MQTNIMSIGNLAAVEHIDDEVIFSVDEGDNGLYMNIPTEYDSIPSPQMGTTPTLLNVEQTAVEQHAVDVPAHVHITVHDDDPEPAAMCANPADTLDGSSEQVLNQSASCTESTSGVAAATVELCTSSTLIPAPLYPVLEVMQTETQQFSRNQFEYALRDSRVAPILSGLLRGIADTVLYSDNVRKMEDDMEVYVQKMANMEKENAELRVDKRRFDEVSEQLTSTKELFQECSLSKKKMRTEYEHQMKDMRHVIVSALDKTDAGMREISTKYTN